MNYKKAFALLLITIIIIPIYFSYSRYLSDFSVNANSSLAKWNISVNNTAVTTNTTTSVNNLTYELIDVNENVVDGKIAPGRSFKASFQINPAETEVSVEYLFNIENIVANENNLNNEISVEKVTYTIGNGEETVINAVNGQYNYIDRLVNNTAFDSSHIINFSIYCKWNVIEDTQFGNEIVTATNVNIPVNLTVKQCID